MLMDGTWFRRASTGLQSAYREKVTARTDTIDIRTAANSGLFDDDFNHVGNDRWVVRNVVFIGKNELQRVASRR